MELDNLMLGELNRRSARYRAFKASRRLSAKGLAEVQRLDLSWINSTCQKKGYDIEGYLSHYYLGVGG